MRETRYDQVGREGSEGRNIEREAERGEDNGGRPDDDDEEGQGREERNRT